MSSTGVEGGLQAVAVASISVSAPRLPFQWTSTQRVMGEVLLRDEKPRDIWDQHEAMLAAVTEGDPEKAEALARQHVMQAANFMINRLRSKRSQAPAAA